MKLSIIIPVFNEERTILEVLRRVKSLEIPSVKKEVIVVDDGSSDSSKFKVQSSKLRGIKIITHEKNQGKGAAVRTGIANATGDYILIQDADLEYDPKYAPMLLEPILQKKATVVYGTRLRRWPNPSRDERSSRFLLHYFGNRFLSFLTSILYGCWITDMETCYKIVPRKIVQELRLRSRSFDFEPELTAKLLKRGIKIMEIPITTNPRGYNEGKKLHAFRDGTIALLALLKYRLMD